MDETNLKRAVEDELNKEPASDYDQVETRICESDRFEGVSLTITGFAVPIRPILDAVEDLDDWKIESIGMYGDADYEEEDGDREYESGIIAFCPYVGDITDSDVFV